MAAKVQEDNGTGNEQSQKEIGASYMIDVKIIKAKGQSALIEYQQNGKIKRSTVRVDDITDGKISPYKLKLGIPYGVEWSKVISLQATADDLEQNLRRMGIWTREDALHNAQAVLGAIQKTYQVDLGAIMRIAKEAK